MKTVQTKVAPPEPKGGGRSASYPAINLQTAVERAQQFWAAEKTSEAPIVAAYKHWGYGEKSSGARLAAAALLSYGILSDRGANENRMVRLTSLGIDIVMAPSEAVKMSRIKEAAQKPRIFADMLRQWDPDNTPSNQTIAHYLVTQKGFNPAGTEACIKNFKETISYAKLAKSDILKGVESAVGREDERPKAKVGDWVQCEIGGVLQFAQPRKVVGISEDQQFVFVEGNSTGLPIGGITVQEVKDKADFGGLPPAPLVKPQAGFKQDVFSLHEGNVILQWPDGMSADSYEDFKSWVELQLRKIARTVKPA